MFPTENVRESNIFSPFVITIELSKIKLKKSEYVKKNMKKTFASAIQPNKKGC